MSAEFRNLRYRLINSLLADGERQGGIGNTARTSLKRMPSGMYWASLGVWQIRQGDCQAQALIGIFRPPAGWLKAADFALTRDRVVCLRECRAGPLG